MNGMVSRPRHGLSVCAGGGGLDLGLMLAEPGFHTRAFVEVQNGCDHRCTFCVIPYGRGNSRSLPAGLVIDRIKALADSGAGCKLA